MSNHGFVIDQRKCIGCHACTVACKAENEVPVGVFRTWVKYIEKGEFPNTRRHFSVMRCNHCADAPCVAICPTKALYVRHDGIVDFDNRRCIGCKSCMAACPYEAIYIDPDEHTAAKCNYCAHRVDVGLQPACVLVCPVQAIVSGDLDDPASTISRLVAREPVRARKPEQGTRPKLFYLGADEASLVPETVRQPEQYIWSEVHPWEHDKLALLGGSASHGPGRTECSAGEARVAYNVAHEKPWERLVSAYLWTKSIAAGVLVLAGALLGLGLFTSDPVLAVAAPAISLVFLGLTTVFLLADLGKPRRFLYILTKPNFSSWLVWGSYILILFGATGALWLAAWLGDMPALLHALVWPAVVLGVLAAIYSGFLFGQAEARDFWQTPLLPIHLFVQSAAAGAAALLLVEAPLGGALVQPLSAVLAGALLLHLVLVLAEIVVPHSNLMVAQSSELIVRGPYARPFWVIALLGGVALPLALLASAAAVAAPAQPVAAGVLALLGLLVYEDIWVQAGQAVPLS
ncbi:MAG: polysulfide reductase NrfD [Chloroflexota bacterium]|nr:polysulfide reductase NrfD [Chloroflexota bacterium]